MAGNRSGPDIDSQFAENICHSNAALTYISQILMDEDDLDEHKKCMSLTSISYKAMEKELAGLLNNSTSSGLSETASSGVLKKFESENEVEKQKILTSQVMQVNEIDILSMESPERMAIDSEQYMTSNGFISTSLPHVPSYVGGSFTSFSISRQLTPDSSQVLLNEFLAQGEDPVESSLNGNQEVRADISLFQGNIRSGKSTHDDNLSKNNIDQQDSLLETSRRKNVFKNVWHHKSLHSFARPAARAQPKAVDSTDPASAGLIQMLVECAQAVSSNDVKEAGRLINDIRRQSSPFGSWKQRLAHYFVEALAARLSGAGPRLYISLQNYSPSVMEMLKALRVYLDRTPYIKIPHFYANEIILHACERESRLHIVDFGILYGIQWPSLIEALANRQGGPPRLRITGIEFPQPGFKPAGRVEETGRRLAEVASLCKVPFEYHALAIKWENIQPASLHLRHDDVLIVNCMFRLRHLMDETMMAESPRKILLEKIRSMNPKIFLQGDLNTGNNSPLGFMNRFHESLADYTNKFEAIDACIPRDSPERLLRDQRAGFKISPLHTRACNKVRDLLKMYHKNFGVSEHGGWLLLGWRGRPTHCVSAWQI
ncbi:hypothetical protein O6H91_15G090400 [Diphasiastrum complanatum]|uniref:Uncharacterized protein n=1 Tax=Diphasiastrum complanatum TaxID=34168 RepID=A0ACC2BKU1_DIPCM|nr:hypothetical protein O6H91_15G090400 [Diphasiastrum complanatum]